MMFYEGVNHVRDPVLLGAQCTASYVRLPTSGGGTAPSPAPLRYGPAHDPTTVAPAAGGPGHRVSRKGEKQQQQANPDTAKGRPATTLSLLPMDLQIGDRFTDAGGEWEIVARPAVTHGGKSLRANVRRSGQPGTERAVSWSAHARVEIRRGPRSSQ